MSFSKDFIWGVGSSAYQTEGACRADGKGPSVWDSFVHLPGTIFAGDHGDTACDGYYHFEEDIALMAKLGIKAYRFSISWPRIFPEGDGALESRGLAYYDHVVDCCLEHGIEPYLTLFHWDLPQALEDRGGWSNPDCGAAFARYCKTLAEHFRGRVRNYFTLNEPQCAVLLGYARGQHAPGKRLEISELFAVWHALLLAHGQGLRAIREADPEARVSLASTGRLCFPQTAGDTEAARQATFAVSDDDWMFTHQMVLDPIFFGRYPQVEKGVLSDLIAAVPQEDLDIINTGLDWLALNIYNGSAIQKTADDFGEYVPHSPGCPRTALKWPITPEVLEFGPQFLFERYQKPVLITENGVSCNDFLYLDGKVHDLDRIDFLTRYLGAIKRTAEKAVPVAGYFHWSFTDNFEWHSGYGDRMGLIYVDYTTQKRTPKDSAAWYAKVIADNGNLL